MKKWMLIALAAIVVLCGGGIWFWLLGSVPSESQRAVILDIQESGVQIQRPDTTIWETATPGMELGEGWSVKTDSKGLATIRFWGQGESRLGSGSEVTITKATMDAEDATKTNVLLKLGAGRIWSRVLKLFDIDSSYAVESNAVVATVRGTAFDVSANADGSAEVWVSESAVDVSPSQGIIIESPEAVAEGQSAIYDTNGRLVKSEPISDGTRSGHWFTWNSQSDAAFVEQEQAQVRAMLAKLGGVGPDSLLYGITQTSERMHLAVTPDARRDGLASRYLARRFSRILDLVGEGKTGLAAQELARIETMVRTQLHGPNAGRERKRMTIALARVHILVADAGPDSPLFPFKQRLENLSEALQEGDDASLLYVRMLNIDARLDEASQFRLARKFDEASMALDVARSGIQNIARESETALATISKDERRAIRGKLAALLAREQTERIALRTAMAPEPSPETATSTEDGAGAATSTLLAPPPTTSAPQATPPPQGTVALPQGSQYQSISLYIQPSPVQVGQAANLIVEATKSDATKADVTSKTTFSIVNGVGSLNGPTVTGDQQGTITVQASYNDNGIIRTSTATVTVQGQVTLTGLTLTSSNGSLIDTYKDPTTQIVASAVYSNGYRKAVTAQTSYQLFSPQAGSMNGSYFTAIRGFTGTADIEGSFTEGGVTVVGNITLNIR